MKLIDLEPSFMKYLGDGSSQYIDDLNLADGIIFLCPTCFETKGNNIGVHSIICWFIGKVPDNTSPNPGRWAPMGTSYNDLSFVDSPGKTRSVKITSGCMSHFLLTDGNIEIV